jgi:hypothetical protein
MAPAAAALMFEGLSRRATRRALERADKRRRAMADEAGEAAPPGVRIDIEGEQVVLSGRGLMRRFLTEARLRWLIAESRDG